MHPCAKPTNNKHRQGSVTITKHPISESKQANTNTQQHTITARSTDRTGTQLLYDRVPQETTSEVYVGVEVFTVQHLH